MLELLAILGFRHDLASHEVDEPSGTGPPTDGRRDYRPHPSLDRAADEALIAELFPCHSPEYC